MKRPVVKYLLIWIGLLLIGGNTISQNPEWMYWDPWSCLIPSRLLNAIEVDDENKKWIGTEPVCGGGICTDGGLAVFDGNTWFVYDSLNSTLNSNFIGSVHIDADNVVWAGTRYGEVSSYDGNWDVHPFPVSGNVPVVSLSSDLYGNIWAATEGNGLFVYDGSDWEQYASSNSPLPDFLSSVAAGPDNSIWAGGATSKLFKYTGDWTTLDIPSGIYFISEIAVNHENSVWLGSEGVFCNYFAGNWTVYDESITGIPDTAVGYVFDIEFDYYGNTWIGHSKGLIKYDGADWTTYSPGNSGLLSEHIQALAADELGNLWIGTADTGLIAYQQGGVVKIEERERRSENRIVLLDPYPNPSTGKVFINIHLSDHEHVCLSVSDLLGREQHLLFKGNLDAGDHVIEWTCENKGLYILELTCLDHKEVKKLVFN